ncbi:MAG: peptide ABC transporter substrate-binding protein, partial [Gemmatimonadales bacterium]
GTVIIAQGADPVSVVPIFASERSGAEIVDQLFLRLAELGPTLRTIGDVGFTPVLARSWSRRDSLTLVFELDPRARWHDGRPVTSRDVVFTFALAREDPRISTSISRIASVTAEGPMSVVMKFTEPYAEQFYDATWHVHILPEHLLGDIPYDSIPRSDFARHPTGSGPFMWERRVPSQFVELRANPDFFLGAPGLERVIFRVAGDPEARLNLLLSGAIDVMSGVRPGMVPRLNQAEELRIIRAPSSYLSYILFNQRDPADTSRRHPILTDIRVRKALVAGIDRNRIARASYGEGTLVPRGPVPQFFHWVEDPHARAADYDPDLARRLLEEAGWRDTDGDGIRDRNGQPLVLKMNTPGVDQSRADMALRVQQQLREIGVKLEVLQVAWSMFVERHNSSNFDLDFAYAGMDPSPAGLRNSWICASAGQAGQNVGFWCNPRFDSLLVAAGRSQDRSVELYRAALDVLEADAPAAFMAAPPALIALHRRFDNVRIRPESLWLSLWEWTVNPDAMLPRDGQVGQ